MSETARREFLKVAGVGAMSLAAANEVSAAPQERLTVGVIGPGGMGTAHTRLLSARKDVQVKYVCDVDSQRMAKAAEIVTGSSGHKPEQVLATAPTLPVTPVLLAYPVARGRP